MGAGFSIGYVNFTIFLLLLTGGFVLYIDVKNYKQKNLNKEKKAALLLGWFNICVGIITWITHLVYQRIS